MRKPNEQQLLELVGLPVCFRAFWASFLFYSVGAYCISILLILYVMSYILGAMTTEVADWELCLACACVCLG